MKGFLQSILEIFNDTCAGFQWCGLALIMPLQVSDTFPKYYLWTHMWLETYIGIQKRNASNPGPGLLDTRVR